MTYKGLRRILSISLRTLPLLILLQSIFCVGGSGILQDMKGILPEMQEIERRGLLDSPPEGASHLVRREIKLVHNSKGLEEYIDYNERSLKNSIKVWFIWAGLFSIILLLRLCFRKGKFPDDEEFSWRKG